MAQDLKAASNLPDDLSVNWTVSICNPFAIEGPDGSITFCRPPRNPEEHQLQLRILARITSNPTSLVPPELVDVKRWICWRFHIDEKGLIRKPPCSPLTGEGIAAIDKYKKHFCDFKTAHAAVKQFGLNGVGFVLVKEDGYVGIDFDHAVKDGVVHPVAEVWRKWFPTYQEFSPSGKGFHILAKGKLPDTLTATALPDSPASVEMYSHDRYFTFSSQGISPELKIVDCQKSIEKLWQELTKQEPSAAQSALRDQYGPMTVTTMRGKYSAMLNTFRAMKRPEDKQNDQLNMCAYFAARAHLAGALEKTDVQLMDELRAVAHSTKHCPGIEPTLRSGWKSGATDGAFQVLVPEQAHAEAIARVEEWLNNKDAPLPDFEDTLVDLALLTEEEYELHRKAVADRFKIRPKEIDKFVAQRRTREEKQPLAIDFKSYDPWDKPVNGHDLLTELVATFRRFIIFKHEHDALVMALWSVCTHLYDEFNIFPRLGLTSPLPECGKTTGLDVLEQFALRATRSDNLTTAVAFRIMEFHPSLLLDELDTFLHDNPELIGVLNSGHKKGGYVFRMEKVNDQQVLGRFATYGPVAYGMIGHPSGPLFSRTIFIRLERKSVEQCTEDFNLEENPNLLEELVKLQRQIIRWTKDHRDEVKNCQPNTASLANRARNNWRPLLKIATVVGGTWPTMTLEAAGIPAPRTKKTDQEKILRDIRNIFHTRQVDRMPSKILLADLLLQKESGWYRYHNKREELDASDIADLLSDFDVEPRAFFASKDLQQKLFQKVEDKKMTCKGYMLDKLEPLFQKYLTGDAEEVEVSKTAF